MFSPGLLLGALICPEAMLINLFGISVVSNQRQSANFFAIKQNYIPSGDLARAIQTPQGD
jgi:hypothetical protein